ncbi:DUF2177 family protein [Variovorax sp. IB41]|jgi:uncharacterized membrane protein|uniref:DUF2177 family protein n=1 Tax=Variovorax sp. IB41 TaxID=2779370 RepID=UPI0018E7384A|nr:DUF2177 family protein [Variovorax sp. IB41]MBJ2159860.1 DUF2177 family protein [Variovorax sp. IB41]
MSTKHLVAWAATFIVLLVIDMLWLGVVAKNMYQQAMGDLMSPEPRLAFAAVFYLLYPIGLLVFAILPGIDAQSVTRAAVLGGLFGLFCYSTYDLTNLAVIRNWPLGLSFIDIAWGTLVSGVAAAAGALALRWYAGR